MITLTSDFGSPYPAAMKGVILSRVDEDVTLVDVAHDLPRQDVRAGAFWLRETLPYFPPAVHLVVVDPGVGTDRRAIVVRAGEHVLVGPDNGVLRPVARRLLTGGSAGAVGADTAGGTDALEAFAIDDADAASATFHGRDVFAPAAAAVHETSLEALASLPSLSRLEPDDLVDLVVPEATVEGDRATGEVLVVDDFGNVITNVPGSFLEGRSSIRVVGADGVGSSDESGAASDDPDETREARGTDDAGTAVPVGETFASVDPGYPLATVGSHGYVELDVNRGRGDDAFGLESGDVVRLLA